MIDLRSYDSLEDIGWNEEWAQEFNELYPNHPDIIPGRVAVRYKGQYAILTAEGEIPARIKGRLRYRAETYAELPVVGDWVAVKKREHESLWRIQEILGRKTVLQRKIKGTKTSAQVMASNVTKAMLVMGLNEDFNIRRLERYFVLINESGIEPVVILNKADLLDEEWLESSMAEVREVAPRATILPISALEHLGIGSVKDLILPDDTIVFLGSSGAGKSTLVNALLGEEALRTAETRDDGRGRHTTTTREMVMLPNGGILIDSPGIREIQIWVEEESESQGLKETFQDIEELANQCRFPDCSHEHEPGCIVLEALENEELDPSRYQNYLQMKEEMKKIRKREEDARRQGKNRGFKQQKRKR